MADTLYIVVPCYNEEEVLPVTAEKLKEKTEQLKADGAISQNSRILFVDDGSSDKTWQIISELHEKDKLYQGVKLSHNRGHQNALLAGLYTAAQYADATVSMDADLQDDIDAIDEMLKCYANGADVVYGVRSKRDKDSFFKRATAEEFYKIMQKMGAEVVFNHADFRLMSKRAIEGLKQFKEVNLFLRGIVPMLGYKTDKVYFERKERFAGKSKYPVNKMLSLAIDGITSFSVKPLSLIFLLAAIFIFGGFVALITTIVLSALSLIPAWSTIICVMVLCTGVLAACLGVVGLYVGKTYIESKHRPPFIIEEYLGD